MNAPVRAADVDWRASASGAWPEREETRVLNLAARLAQAVVRPCALLESLEGRLEPLSVGALSKMVEDRHFGPHAQRAVSAEMGIDRLPLKPDLFERLGGSPASRLCVLLVCAPFAALRDVAQDMAMAILHKRVLRLLLKKHRSFFRAAIGEEGLRLAAQEAPLLYPALGELDRAAAFDAMLNSDDEGALKAGVAGVGFAGLMRFVERTEPDLADLFACRRTIPSDQVLSMSARHGDQTVRLLRRRRTAWSNFID